MSSQITHLYFAQKLIPKLPQRDNLDLPQYYTGSIFPDIRYMAKLSRESTHFNNPTIEGLFQLTDSHDIGAYAHVLLDELRANAMDNSGFYDYFGTGGYNSLLTTASKFVEDRLLYPRVEDISGITHTFLSDIPQELLLVDSQTLIIWHQHLQRYCQNTISHDSLRDFGHTMRFEDNSINKLLERMTLIDAQREAVTILANLTDGILDEIR